MPASVQDLLTLPGIGPYTAGAISSIAYGRPAPAVDGNVLRVMARFRMDGRDMANQKVRKSVEEDLSAAIPADRPGDFNQAMMEIGAMVCLPNGAPRCGNCPVQHLCLAYHRGNASTLPVRAAKKARRIENRTVLLVRCGAMVGIRRRPARGLLAGLWELPSLDGHLSPDETRPALTAQGWQVQKLLSLRPAKHIFTHVEWHMTGYYVELASPANGLTWVTPSALRGDYALPSAFRAFLQVIEEEM